MQVILLKDIKTLGKAGEVRNVSDGYAVNFLVPQKLAVMATADKLAELKTKLAKMEKEKKDKLSQDQNLAVRLQGLKLEIKAKAAQGGKLFAGISEKDIAGELKHQRNIIVPEKSIKIQKHIKEIGEQAVTIDLAHGSSANIVIKIIPLE